MPITRPEDNHADDDATLPWRWLEFDDADLALHVGADHVAEFNYETAVCIICHEPAWSHGDLGRLVIASGLHMRDQSRGWTRVEYVRYAPVHLQCVQHCEGHSERVDVNLFMDEYDEFCEECNENRTSCDYRRCDVTDWSDNMYWDDENEEHYCDYHYRLIQEEREDGEEEGEDDSGDIRSYSYRPIPMFRIVNPLDEVMSWTGRHSIYGNLPFLGFELETNCRASYSEKRMMNIAGARHLISAHASDYLYAKEDGSITGFEIVSHPTTVDAHRRLIVPEAFRALATDFQQSSWTSVDGVGAGLHVHINKSSFAKPSHIQRFQMFHYVNSDIIKKFAGRDSRRWATFDKPDDARLMDLSRGMSQYNRYSAMNFQNSSTIELRYFRGSLQTDTLIGVLEFVHSVWRYTQVIHAKEVADGGCQWHRYRNWLQDEYSSLGFTNLLPLMDKRGV